MSKIEIWRENQFKDALRAYQIELDEKIIGEVRKGETISLDIEPGKHHLRLKIDWCSSPGVDFEIHTGQTVKFSCGNNLKPLTGFVYITFLRNQYLWLKQLT